ncbi:MAG TPA: hypothetical protein VGE57_07410 [Solimonas sp.]
MRSHLIAIVPAFALLSGLPLTTAAADSQPQPASAAEVESPTAKPQSRHCLTETGSRIARSPEQPCIAAPGQVLTREELDRSGAIDTADAIRRQVPAVR